MHSFVPFFQSVCSGICCIGVAQVYAVLVCSGICCIGVALQPMFTRTTPLYAVLGDEVAMDSHACTCTCTCVVFLFCVTFRSGTTKCALCAAPLMLNHQSLSDVVCIFK